MKSVEEMFRSTSSKNYEGREEHDIISLGASILPLRIAAGSPVASILPLHMAAGVSCVVFRVNFFYAKKRFQCFVWNFFFSSVNLDTI